MNATDHAVTLAPLLPSFTTFIGLVFAGLSAWAVRYLTVFLKAHQNLVDQQTQALIEAAFSRALQNGLKIAQARLTDDVKKHLTISTDSWLSQQAGQWAVDHSPDYLTTFFGGKTQQEALDHAAAKALALLPAVPKA